MNKKLAYIVFWNMKEVGRIYENDEKQYTYFPDYPEIEKMEDAPIAIIGIPQLEWGDMPSFFKERIEKDPDCKNSCRCATDKITIGKS